MAASTAPDKRIYINKFYIQAAFNSKCRNAGVTERGPFALNIQSAKIFAEKDGSSSNCVITA
jgi:hypothetical protein